ncbi:hypothetical protein CT0861_05151 [Colletotrichum tofieldiae]|uniref:Uncharacterized protein n=1 Tax=Colletotrichum tofieldiae TaxID=708197 RepID=A0A166XVQ3_9PEZI|nr:hypothetical protein CT0861_05151 [Colletotrichum tofieldiae]
MHVCAIPQEPIPSTNGQPRSGWSPGWRRWRPSNMQRPKNPVVSKKDLLSRPEKSQPSREDKRAPTSSSMDETQVDEKSHIAAVSELEISPLLNHERLSRCSTGRSLRERSIKARLRLQQLFRSQGSHHKSESDASRGPSKSSRKPSKKASKAQNNKKVSETEGGSLMNDMAYHVAAGLCWYLPAPFDLMPQGYPTRQF